MKTLEDRFWSKVDRAGECWVWTATRYTKTQYGKFQVDGRERYAHRVSWALAYGPISPPTLHVLHKCDNPPCVNPAHLFLGTQADNMKDMAAKGRTQRGSRHHFSKVTEEDVRAIRRLAGSVPGVVIGRQFGISASTVSGIVSGKHWRHVR